MNGCPKCGGDRVKAAPMPVVGALLAPFSRRRLYACKDCGWRWWSRRLRHRSAGASLGAHSSVVSKRAVLFFTLALLTIVVSGFLAMRECGARGPAPVELERP